MRMLLLLSAFAVFAVAAPAPCAQAKVLAGLMEEVVLNQGEVTVLGKLDTGARVCSLHAQKIKVFRKGGKRWVRFTTLDVNETPVTMELPLAGHMKVKRPAMGGQQRRPFVKMTVCLGGVKRTVEVNLVNRIRFSGRMLVGRNFMKGHLVVDPGLSRLTKPVCGTEAKE